MPDIFFEICADQDDPAADFFLERTEHPRVPGIEPVRIWLLATFGRPCPHDVSSA
jgi:hypothetical protein